MIGEKVTAEKEILEAPEKKTLFIEGLFDSLKRDKKQWRGGEDL